MVYRQLKDDLETRMGLKHWYGDDPWRGKEKGRQAALGSWTVGVVFQKHLGQVRHIGVASWESGAGCVCLPVALKFLTS